MRSRLGIIVLVGLAGCSEALRHVPPPPDADEHAALTVIRCGRGLTVEAVPLEPLPITVELPADCPDDAEVNVLYLGETLEALGLSAGAISASTCARDETAYDTCCTPEPLPSAKRVFSGRGGGMTQITDAPEDIAAFRHNERCLCRTFDVTRIEVPGSYAPVVLRNDDTSIWVLSSSVSTNELSAFLVPVDRSSGSLTVPDYVFPFVARHGVADPSGDWTLVSVVGDVVRGSVGGGFRITENAVPEAVRVAGSGDEMLLLERSVVSGTAAFGRFDGERYQPLSQGVLPEFGCSGSQSDGGRDGQEEGLIRLDEGDYIAMPNFVDHNGQEFAPDGYWRHQNGESCWERFGSTTDCTTAISALADGRLIRATTTRRFEVREAETWVPAENIAGPNGPALPPKEIKLIEPYGDGFVFAGNSALFGQHQSGIMCYFDTTPGFGHRAVLKVEDRLVVTERTDAQPHQWALKIYTPRPFRR